MELRAFGKDYAHHSEHITFCCNTRDDTFLLCRGTTSTHQSLRRRRLSEFWIHPLKWQICRRHHSVLAAWLTRSCSSSRCPRSITHQHHRWPARSTSQSAGHRDTTLWLWPAVILYRSVFLQLSSLKLFLSMQLLSWQIFSGNRITYHLVITLTHVEMSAT